MTATPTPTPDPVLFTLPSIGISSEADGELSVLWSAPSQAPTDYQVNWAKAAEEYPALDGSVGVITQTATSIAIIGLDEGVEYKVRVRARYYDGSYADNPQDGSWNETSHTVSGTADTLQLQLDNDPTATPTTTATATPTPTDVPTVTPTPTLLPRAVSNVVIRINENGEAVVAWAPPTEAPADYRIAWAEADQEFPSYTEDHGNAYPTEPTYTITDLTPGVRYKIILRARYNGPAGPWNEAVEFDVPALPTATATVTVTAASTATATSTPTATPTATPTVTPAVAGIATDRAALMALFNSTDGDNWNYPQYAGGWGSTASLDQWDGVTTDASGRVTELTLSYRMHGTLPSALGNLSKLKVLYIEAFSLSGSIPTELGNLSNLEELTLHGWSLRAPDDGLSGSIPTQLGNLSKLKKLDFAHNDLSGSIPTELGNLTKLQELSLTFNDLSGSIPTQLGNLSKLTEIEPHFQRPERFDSNATGQPLRDAGIVSQQQQSERSHPI